VYTGKLGLKDPFERKPGSIPLPALGKPEPSGSRGGYFRILVGRSAAGPLGGVTVPLPLTKRGEVTNITVITILTSVFL